MRLLRPYASTSTDTREDLAFRPRRYLRQGEVGAQGLDLFHALCSALLPLALRKEKNEKSVLSLLSAKR